MKTTNSKILKAVFLVSFTFLIFLFSCDSEQKTNNQKVVFGIHEVININEIPAAVIDSLKSKAINNYLFLVIFQTQILKFFNSIYRNKTLNLFKQ